MRHVYVFPSGERCEVSLEVRVDDRTAAKLNTCQDKLYDILVLHLENGKDIFITVQGELPRGVATRVVTIAHTAAGESCSADILTSCRVTSVA